VAGGAARQSTPAVERRPERNVDLSELRWL